MIRLRPYQARAEEAVFREWETVNATAVIHATGLGKTVLASRVIQRVAPKRVLYLAHRRELVLEPKDKLESFCGIDADIEMGAWRAEEGLWGRKQVVVSSVQTQFASDGRRQFKPTDFDYLILDEMHHYVGAPEFRGVVEHYKQNPNLKILGLTATPKRTDQKALGQIFDSVADAYEIVPAIRDGWLVNVKPRFVPVFGLDYSHIATVAGELNGSQLARVLDSEEIVQGMIQPTVEHAWGCPEQTLNNHPVSEWKSILDTFGEPLRTLMFCKTVAQAEMFANILNRIHSGLAAMVCGDRKKVTEDERAKIGRDFKNGPLHFVANVDVYSEGYDNPYLQMLVMARPLKSLLKYMQCLGRGTRPWPGTVDGREVEPGVFVDLDTAEERLAAIAASKKPDLKVLDFTGNSGSHKIINCIDALGGEMDDATVERAIKSAQDGTPRLVSELLEKSAEEIRDEIEKCNREEEARKSRLVAKTRYATIAVNPFDVLQIQPVRERGWEAGKQLSEKQNTLLLKQGIDGRAMPYVQAKAVLNEIFRRWAGKLCTFKQAKLLKKHGYETKQMTMKAASEKITALANNGWKRPTEPSPVADVPSWEPPVATEVSAPNLGGWR